MVSWWIFSDTFIITILVYTVVSLSLNLEAGFTGIPNFGKHVFVFLGAFASQGLGIRFAAYLWLRSHSPEEVARAVEAIKTFNPLLELSGDPRSQFWHLVLDPKTSSQVVQNYLVPFINSSHELQAIYLLFVATMTVVLAALFGLLASFAALRLREDYLAILLLSFAELMTQVIFYQVPTLNGGNVGYWAITLTGDAIRFSLAASAVIAVLAFVYSELLANSPMGRAMRAVRDDDLAARVYGRSVAMIRLKVIIVASIMAALAGMAYIQSTPASVSNSFDRVAWTFLPWAMIILGGMANNLGAVLGAFVFLVGMQLFTYYQDAIAGLLHMSNDTAALLPNFLVAILIILVLYLRPQGILPERPSRTVDFRRILVEEGE